MVLLFVSVESINASNALSRDIISCMSIFQLQVGWSPLHYAVLGGHVAVVEALLRAGAYPCFRDNHLISPLHLASTQPGEKETFRRIAELLGPPALLARDEVRGHVVVMKTSAGFI